MASVSNIQQKAWFKKRFSVVMILLHLCALQKTKVFGYFVEACNASNHFQ